MIKIFFLTSLVAFSCMGMGKLKEGTYSNAKDIASILSSQLKNIESHDGKGCIKNLLTNKIHLAQISLGNEIQSVEVGERKYHGYTHRYYHHVVLHYMDKVKTRPGVFCYGPKQK